MYGEGIPTILPTRDTTLHIPTIVHPAHTHHGTPCTYPPLCTYPEVLYAQHASLPPYPEGPMRLMPPSHHTQRGTMRLMPPSHTQRSSMRLMPPSLLGQWGAYSLPLHPFHCWPVIPAPKPGRPTVGQHLQPHELLPFLTVFGKKLEVYRGYTLGGEPPWE